MTRQGADKSNITRRKFIKSISAIPFIGCLFQNKTTGKLRDKPMYCWTPAGDSNLPFDTQLLSTYDEKGIYAGCIWKVDDAKWTTRERNSNIFTVWKNGKVISTFKVNG